VWGDSGRKNAFQRVRAIRATAIQLLGTGEIESKPIEVGPPMKENVKLDGPACE
jgi:hypothetical protein